MIMTRTERAIETLAAHHGVGLDALIFGDLNDPVVDAVVAHHSAPYAEPCDCGCHLPEGMPVDFGLDACCDCY